MLGDIWFALWGVLWAIYFVLDGFDLGLGTVMPFLARNEKEKRTFYNAAGPFWDGNEVWLITAGGVTFAAFPLTYATMFSTMYTPLMLFLFTLIIRGVSFEFRAHLEKPSSKAIWDHLHTVFSFLPALLVGVAFGNIFMGIPFDENYVYQGDFFTFLRPYPLAAGVLFVLMFIMHGCIWLCHKTHGELHARSRLLASKVWPILTVWTVLFLGFTAFATDLFANFLDAPYLLAVLIIAVVGLVMARVHIGTGKMVTAWWSSAVYIFMVAAFGVIGLYPRLLPSSLDPAYSMTIEKTASSPLTLQIMLGVALVFVPIVIFYQSWVYKVFSHKIDHEELAKSAY